MILAIKQSTTKRYLLPQMLPLLSFPVTFAIRSRQVQRSLRASTETLHNHARETLVPKRTFADLLECDLGLAWNGGGRKVEKH
ncbi:hypothetical protein CERZMDRAFT_108498 [Cercospora zeae-maydis SCOH1-5]|uniref:Uncharacterized protein n=1 Tax=Cercospora zeae-maydis SCOH1-5 TaxID=717836 RepID=A0A6A6FWS4_9PEZI|nr:hypothetical protein CERZMDRAFT_108498 [Cercospora zeae-maydis SCOH1-5]